MSRIRAPRLAPHSVAGLAGMLLVAALFIINALLVRNGGRGLGAAWLLALLLPGALAAHLSLPRDTQRAWSWAKEGTLAGLTAGHVAATVWVVWLVIAVTTTDWARYAQQVGPEIAHAVRDAALPATVVASLAAIVVAYAGCAGAAWLGASIYFALRAALLTGNK